MEDSSHPQAALHSEMPTSTEISSTVAPTSALESRNGMLISKTMDNESQTSGSLTSAQNDPSKVLDSPFLKLPAEIRVRVYGYLLHACGRIHIYVSKPDFVVSEDTVRCCFPHKDCSSQSKHFGKMVSYRVYAPGVHPVILSVNRQTYLEATKLFYSENCFKFNSNTTIIPFLEDRSEDSRRLIKQIEFDREPTVGLQHFVHLDHLFEDVCNYSSRFLQLEHLTLKYWIVAYGEERNSASYKYYLSNIDKKSWVQQLVPLVKQLKSFSVYTWGDDQDDLMLAAQTYLRSMMDNASKECAPESDSSRDGTRSSSSRATTRPWGLGQRIRNIVTQTTRRLLRE